MIYECLTNDQKAHLIRLYDDYGPKWTCLSRITGIKISTIRSFILRYNTDGTLSPKRGAPKKITEEIENNVIDYFENLPETSLTVAANNFGLSNPSIKTILNSDGIKYFKKVPIPNLTNYHKIKRMDFSTKISNYSQENIPNFIITDESTVEENLEKGGIWRRRGHFPPGTFYTKEGHPISVMVWRGIGPGSYRTKLLRVHGKMNSIKYVDLLLSNDVFIDIEKNFGKNYIFQQDNAPPHKSRYTMGVLSDIVPEVLDWPAKSPDLSPIEQLWHFLKGKLAGVKFKDQDELFDRLVKEWNDIPTSVINNIYSSFQARCIVCMNHNGECLNGLWKEVKKIHDSYRLL